MSKVSMGDIKMAWKLGSLDRGYNFGFNLKTLLPDGASHIKWFAGAKELGVKSCVGTTVNAYFPPLYISLVNNQKFDGNLGVQEIHWDKPGSHTDGVHAEQILGDFHNINAVLINHSEVIGEQGRTLDQAAKQLRKALDTTVDGRTFKFITLCVGEDRETHRFGTDVAVDFVNNQILTVFDLAKVNSGEMPRIGIAYEPRFAIQVGSIPGIPPTDEHIRTMGWSILQTVAEAVGLEGMSKMFALQYGGSMKGPEDKTAPVQHFVGPGNQSDEFLYNGGLIGTAGAKIETVEAILRQILLAQK